MISAIRLRNRMLLALSSTGIALSTFACGGNVVEPSASSATTGAGGTSTTTATTGGDGGAGGGVICAGIDSDPAPPPCTACFPICDVPNANGCLVGTTCPATYPLPCQSTIGGPWVKNCQCCYEFGQPEPICGRPFVIDGESVRADAVARSDWQIAARGIFSPESLDAATRSAIASAWLEDARLEHASIASFARFSLHLLALGAPADLVESAQRAALDEVMHARLCFGLASRYADEALGAGALPTGGAVTPLSLEEAVAATVREGCVGETIASLFAAEQLASAEDEDVRAALARIAEDEGQHAELAFRFVAWGIATGGRSVRDAARRAFAEALAEVPRREEIVGVDEAAFRRHGRLPPAIAARVRERAIVEVIAPCAHALDLPVSPRSALGLDESVA